MPMRRFLLPLFLVACGSSASETDLETAFCDLLENGPEQTVTATADEQGPEVAVEDAAVVVELIDDGTGSFSGTVRYSADEMGSFAIGLSADIPFAVTDGTGATIDPTNEVSGASCDGLAIRYTVPLEIDTYMLAFGPTDIASITLVSEESDDDL